MRLEGKVAIITGGAGGIGVAAAKRFAAEGASILLVDLVADQVEAAVAEVGSNAVAGCVADVTSEADNLRMIAECQERFGGVDILLANAGIEGQVGSMTDLDVNVFDRVMAVNVRGVWLGMRAAFPAMQERGGGSVVITSSVAGIRGSAGLSPYVTSKHAVIGMMKSAAKEGAPLAIRVNTVNPSPVNTRMMRSLEEGMSPGAGDAAREAIAQSIPLGRYGEPEDIANVMLFLASDESRFVTGSVYMADGGNTA